MSAPRLWADIPASGFHEIDPDRTIAVLPTAAVEQHGPHLPVGVDTHIAFGMVSALCARDAGALDVRILPVQAVGKSNEHLYAPGTLTLDAATALAAWTQIGLSVARTGIRKLVIVNSHGGNLDLIHILARELRVQAGMLAVTCQWGAFGYPEGLYSEAELTHGLHGGDVETSLMLALAPDTVVMQRAANFATTATQTPVPPTGPIRYGWIASDLNPDGVVGEAAKATAEKGRATIDHQVTGFMTLLRDVSVMAVPGTTATEETSK